ncbi:hypothetical protein [Nannocystis pusilla]|uniref:hypothetical protein n=1 Tax=Nannocystis pusilla TaxID=889268 RepID=UPI003DA68F4F
MASMKPGKLLISAVWLSSMLVELSITNKKSIFLQPFSAGPVVPLPRSEAPRSNLAWFVSLAGLEVEVVVEVVEVGSPVSVLVPVGGPSVVAPVGSVAGAVVMPVGCEAVADTSRPVSLQAVERTSASAGTVCTAALRSMTARR